MWRTIKKMRAQVIDGETNKHGCPREFKSIDVPDYEKKQEEKKDEKSSSSDESKKEES